MTSATTTPSQGDIVALWGLCAYGSRENLAA